VNQTRTVMVPAERVARWFDNFGSRHGAADIAVEHGALRATADDGAVARACLPFGRRYDGPPDAGVFAEVVAADVRWGILLVRKGGFAIAYGHGSQTLLTKVGQRHVQGTTKAGGQSQQRFARRRDNQARQAYAATAHHAHRILVQSAAQLDALVCGGDHGAVEAVLSDRRLRGLVDLRTEPFLVVPDPRRAVLDRAILDARSARITVEDGAGHSSGGVGEGVDEVSEAGLDA